MSDWHSAINLIGIGSLPNTIQGINKKAKREDWKWRKRNKQGGGKEYHISSLPPETQQQLRAHHAEKPVNALTVVSNEGKTPTPFTERNELALTPDEMALVLKYRDLNDQLKTQSQSILDIFSQQKIGNKKA